MKKLFAMVCAACVVLMGAQGRLQTPTMVEWPHVGGHAGQTKYSTAADITPANVNQLELAWKWEPREEPLPDGTRPGSIEATPLMIDNVLYLSTSYNRVVALNAETGAQLWAFDPKAILDGPGTGLYQYYTHRGVAYWRDGNDARVFMNSHWRLFSVDGKTGQLVTTFGKDGYVDLTEGVRSPIKKGHMRQTSPPVIYKNLVIVGSSIPDHVIYRNDPTGTVAAYDVRTGKRAWIFYTVPQPGEFGNETWENESWAFTGHANVWGPMSLDDARGLLYLPVSTPSSDSWGGRRPGANLFAESLVCLDAATGKRKWHFQAVHHGLWDYDFGAPPALTTIMVDGRKIDAVAEVSKQGFTYVFDRVTGKPVWPIEERPVDTSTDVPGEKPYATQPFPTKPPPFSPQGVTLEDANDLTPEIHEIAVEEMKKYRLGPLFTPPSLQGTLARPGNVGGANWGGVGFDPETGMLYVKPTQLFSVYQVCKNDGSDLLIDTDYRFYCDEMPAARARGRSPNKLGGIPLTRPPYAELVAINLNKGEIAWRVPLGEGSASWRRSPLLKGVTLPERLGSPNATGPLVTKGGLVFAGSSDSHLYVFDKATGREITRLATPFPVEANPMTYKARSGRQFVVVAVGAGPDATLVAFALPAQPSTASPR
jgi:quinoprotein glucose dehydrogenase